MMLKLAYFSLGTPQTKMVESNDQNKTFFTKHALQLDYCHYRHLIYCGHRRGFPPEQQRGLNIMG